MVGLHALEGVKGHDQGNVQLVFESMPRQSAQPVVGVQRIRDTVLFEVAGDLVGEDLDVITEFIALESPRRSGRHVVDSKSRLHQLRGRQ